MAYGWSAFAYLASLGDEDYVQDGFVAPDGDIWLIWRKAASVPRLSETWVNIYKASDYSVLGSYKVGEGGAEAYKNGSIVVNRDGVGIVTYSVGTGASSKRIRTLTKAGTLGTAVTIPSGITGLYETPICLYGNCYDAIVAIGTAAGFDFYPFDVSGETFGTAISIDVSRLNLFWKNRSPLRSQFCVHPRTNVIHIVFYGSHFSSGVDPIGPYCLVYANSEGVAEEWYSIIESASAGGVYHTHFPVIQIERSGIARIHVAWRVWVRYRQASYGTIWMLPGYIYASRDPDGTWSSQKVIYIQDEYGGQGAYEWHDFLVDAKGTVHALVAGGDTARANYNYPHHQSARVGYENAYLGTGVAYAAKTRSSPYFNPLLTAIKTNDLPGVAYGALDVDHPWACLMLRGFPTNTAMHAIFWIAFVDGTTEVASTLMAISSNTTSWVGGEAGPGADSATCESYLANEPQDRVMYVLDVRPTPAR